jgi:type I restriction enzyme M protein
MVQSRKLPADAMQPPLLPREPRGKNGRGDLGFEATLWQAADKLRGNLDAAEYKHVVLGLIFLKYISDAFEEKRQELRSSFRRQLRPREWWTSS